MKKFCFLILFISSIAISLAQSNLPKLSPRTQLYLLQLKEANGKLSPQPDYVYKQTTYGVYMSAVLKVNSSIKQAELDALGVHIGTRAGNIWTAQIPINNVSAFTKTAGIDYIELDEPVYANMDSVRISTRVDSVHEGINLPMAYSGKGVVMGIIDVGYDLTHPTFYDTAGNEFRIKKVWMEKTIGTPPSGFIYGSELTDSSSIIDAQTDNTGSPHGTHVAGIAAGSGYGSAAGNNNRYRGVAYESELVMVGIMPDSLQWQNTGVSDMIDGLSYIFDYAESVGKPAVANLSWGSPIGPHDGTSLFSQAVDALTGPGKIFVCSAGNDGETKIHLSKTFTATDTTVSTFVGFDNALTPRRTWVDMWGEAGKTFCASVSLYHGTEVTNTGFLCLDDIVQRFTLQGSNFAPCYVTFVTSSAEFNGKPRIHLTIQNQAPDSVCLTIIGTDGTIHLWNGYVTNGMGYKGNLTNGGRTWATAGNTDYITSDLVSTNSSISAGAYAAKNRYRSITATNYNFASYVPVGGLVPFSSHGPTVDGYVKPDITAPGFCVVSALNSFDADYIPAGSSYSSVVSSYHNSNNNRNYYYGQLSGTSMSSPVTSGVVALMLQANPLLSPAHVRNILAQTAIQDTFTGVLPLSGINTWGHGKINAYGAVIAAATYPVGVKPYQPQNQSCQLFPNPTNGNFVLSFTSNADKNLTTDIYDISGRLVYTEQWKALEGNNTRHFNLLKQEKGFYLVRISSTQGIEAMLSLVIE